MVDYCVKVMGSSSRALPVVNLHMKSSEQEMVCVNDEMLRDPSLFKLALQPLTLQCMQYVVCILRPKLWPFEHMC